MYLSSSSSSLSWSLGAAAAFPPRAPPAPPAPPRPPRPPRPWLAPRPRVPAAAAAPRPRAPLPLAALQRTSQEPAGSATTEYCRQSIVTGMSKEEGDFLPTCRNRSPHGTTSSTDCCNTAHCTSAAHYSATACSPSRHNTTHCCSTATHRPPHHSSTPRNSSCHTKPPAECIDARVRTSTLKVIMSVGCGCAHGIQKSQPMTRNNTGCNEKYHLCETATWRFTTVLCCICVNRASRVIPPPPLAILILRGGIFEERARRKGSRIDEHFAQSCAVDLRTSGAR